MCYLQHAVHSAFHPFQISRGRQRILSQKKEVMAVVSLLKVDTGYSDTGEREWLGEEAASFMLRGGTVLPSGAPAGAKAGCALLSQAVPEADRLGPGTLLQCLDKHLLEQQNAKETRRDKNNHVVPNLGQVMDNKIQKTKTPNCHFGRAGSRGPALASSTQQHQSGGQTAKPPLSLPWTTPPTLPPYEEPACLPQEGSKGMSPFAPLAATGPQ